MTNHILYLRKTFYQGITSLDVVAVEVILDNYFFKEDFCSRRTQSNKNDAGDPPDSLVEHCPDAPEHSGSDCLESE